MSMDVADRGLLATVLELERDPDAPATGAAIAEALGVPAAFADFIERRLQRNRELGLLECDELGNWYPTAAAFTAVHGVRLLGQAV